MSISEDEIARLTPKMQEAVRFVQYWQLARDLSEFLACMDKACNASTKLWASNTATKYRKKGVPLRKLSDKTGMDVDLDYSYLMMVSERALATLGRKKQEAEDLLADMPRIHSEGLRILGELRKFKSLAIDREKIRELAGTNGGH